MRTLLFVAVVAVALLLPVVLFAGDWPGWRGPDRTDVSKETGLLQSWPDGGPKLLWTFHHAGTGYGGLAVVGDVVYAMGAEGDREFVFALDTAKHNILWKTEIGGLLENKWGDGPRGTPTVDGDLVFGTSGLGEVFCVSKNTGKTKWAITMTKDLGGKVPLWGYTESPLADGDLLIVTPGGGREGKGSLAALNKHTGAVRWQCKELSDDAGFSSPVVTEACGVRQYVQTLMWPKEKGPQGGAVAGVEAATGELLWYYPQKEYRTAVIPTPIVRGNCVYVTQGYGAGCDLLKLRKDGDKFKAEQVYANKNMENHHGGVVLFDDYVYGFSDGKGWICQELKTGKIVWSDRALGKGCLTCADGRLYCYEEKEGGCVLVEASPKGWNECGRLKLPQHTKLPRQKGRIWTHPVVSNGKLYLRDQDLIFCFDVKDGK